MNQPSAIDWDEVARRFPVGALVEGTVTKQVHFGVFLDIGHPHVLGLLRIVDLPDAGPGAAQQWPPLGSRVRGAVLGISSGQVVIGMRPGQLALVKGQS